MKRIRKTICLLLFGFLFAALSNQVLAAEDTVSDEIKTANYTVESSSIQETSVSGVEEVEQLQTDLQESNLTIPLELDVVEDEPEVISTDIATEIGVTENTVSLADHETSLTDEIHSSVAGNEEGEAKVDGQSDPDSTDLTLEETIDTATEEAEEILERDEAEVTEQHITEADEQNITEVAEPDSAEGVEQDVAEATEPVAVEVIEPDSAEVIEQDVAEATEPVAVEVAEPEPAEGVERDVAEATEPVAVEVIEPEPAEGVERDVAEATEPVAIEAIESDATDNTEETTIESATRNQSRNIGPGGLVIEEGVVIGYVGSGEEVVIPNSFENKNVYKIGKGAFQDKNQITKVVFGANVMIVDDDAFNNCTNLAVVVPSKKTDFIGKRAFKDCKSLYYIPINPIHPDLLVQTVRVKEECFAGCESLQVFPFEYIDRASTRAFVDSGVLAANLTNVTVIKEAAFMNCTQLRALTIGNECNNIEKNAFAGCSSLKNVIIPGNVFSLDSGAFTSCTGLEYVQIEEGVQSMYGTYHGLDEDAEPGVFQGCINLKTVRMPSQFFTIGPRCFKDCVNLTNINLPTELRSLEMVAFSGCRSLKYLDLSNLTEIDTRVFEKTGLEYVNLPNATKISWNAFRDCQDLQTVVLSDQLTELDQDVFRGCIKLKHVTFPGTIKEIPYGTFAYCESLESFIIPEGVESLPDADWTNIGAFHECTSLRTITFPSTLKRIGNRTFSNCYALSNLQLPETLESIGISAFRRNWNLRYIYIPSRSTTIEQDAFFETAKNNHLNSYDDIVIYGHTGSAAESFANSDDHCIFVDINGQPAPVTGITARPYGSGAVTIKWDPALNVDGYFIYRRVGSTGELEYLTLINKANFTDFTARNNEWNYYFVFSYRKKADGTIWSSPMNRYGYGQPQLGEVPSIKTYQLGHQVAVGWQKVNGADGYAVYKRVEGNTNLIYLGSYDASQLGMIDMSPTCGTINYYFVCPYIIKSDNTQYMIKPSKYAYRVMPEPQIGRVKSAYAKQYNHYVAVSWSNAKVAGYFIYRKVEGETGLTKIGQVDGFSYYYYDVNPVKNKTNFYFIRPYVVKKDGLYLAPPQYYTKVYASVKVK